jgi:hypothetical protein
VNPSVPITMEETTFEEQSTSHNATRHSHAQDTGHESSSITETGNALNQVLFFGPTVQPESIDIITQYREKKYVITGDVSKMYRQIWDHPSQRKFLPLLWRPSTNEAIKHHQINVVTFGTPCVPSSNPVLKMIAEEHQNQVPESAEILSNTFYVDDKMFGINANEKGIKNREQLRYMLTKSVMKLAKMTANHPAILTELSMNCVEVSETSNFIKALGILYDVRADEFSCKMKPPKAASPELTYNQKHQIIMPFSNCASQDFHQEYLHSFNFQRFWNMKAKIIVKKAQHECIRCFRVKSKTSEQLMTSWDKTFNEFTRFQARKTSYHPPKLGSVFREIETL